MKKLPGILTALILAVLLTVLSGCGEKKDASPTQEPTAKSAPAHKGSGSGHTEPPRPTQGPTEAPTQTGPSPAYIALNNLISTSGADGYTICKVIGLDNQTLLLSFGQVEATRRYEFYSINADGVKYIGEMSAGHSYLYTNSDTGTLGYFWGHMGYYKFGTVEYKDGAFTIYPNDEHQIEPEEEYPDPPGTPITLTEVTDLSLIDTY